MKLVFIPNRAISKGNLFTQFKKNNIKIINQMSEIFFDELYEVLITKFQNFQKKISKADMRKLFWTITSLYKTDRDRLINSETLDIKTYLGSFTPNIQFSIARKTIDLYYQYFSDSDYFEIKFTEVYIYGDLNQEDQLTQNETLQLEEINTLITDIIVNQDMMSFTFLEGSKLTLGQIDLIPEMETYYSILDKLIYPEISEERYFVEINNQKIYFDKLSKFTSPDRLKLYQELDQEYNRLSNYSNPN